MFILFILLRKSRQTEAKIRPEIVCWFGHQGSSLFGIAGYCRITFTWYFLAKILRKKSTVEWLLDRC